MFAQMEEMPQELVNANYQRNLLAISTVLTMVLVWVTKLSSSAPMKKPLAR
jgi:hypothetical protein